MPYIKSYLHVIWGTKNRQPFLHSLPLRKKVWHHIYVNARLKGIHLDVVNGYSEHCHCLLSLKPNQSIDRVVQFLKGESSYWINKQGLLNGSCYSKFSWQHEYFAVSVSPEGVPFVRRYIKTQEEHHKIQSYNEEYNQFLNKNGLRVRR